MANPKMTTDNQSIRLPENLPLDFRVGAQQFCAGPDGMDWKVADELHYGWGVLSLAYMSGTGSLSETRVAYVNPYADEQRFAILRAAQWERGAIRRWLYDNAGQSRAEIEKAHIEVQGKRVLITAELAVSWANALAGLRAPAPAFRPDSPDDSGYFVIRLKWMPRRHEWHLTWATDALEYTEEAAVWRQLWTAMGAELRNGSEVTDVVEAFWNSPVGPTFDLLASRYLPIDPTLDQS